MQPVWLAAPVMSGVASKETEEAVPLVSRQCKKDGWTRIPASAAKYCVGQCQRGMTMAWSTTSEMVTMVSRYMVMTMT